MTRFVLRPGFARPVLWLAAATVLSVSACTSGGGTPAATTTLPAGGAGAGSGATGTSPATTPAGAPHRPSQVAVGLTQAQAEAALLTRAEVGAGLAPTAPNEQTQPFPCTPETPPLDQVVPAPVHAAVSFTDPANSFEVTERIDNYASAATAQRALSLTERGLGCNSGSLGSIPVTIGAPADLSKNLTTTVDKSEAWEITASSARQSYIVTKIDTQLVTLIFGETSNAAGQNVDAAGIVQKAIAKVGLATQ